jgi:16S rRNA processing protein RimM
MGKVYVGKIVSTHGIKGEVKIISDFEYKDKVFIVGNKLLIDDRDYIIKSYRHHKNFEMVTLNDYKDINEVLFLMKKKVFIDEEELNLLDNEVLDEELVTYNVVTTDGEEGKILEVFFASPGNKILRVMLEKEVLIPVKSPMLKEINKKDKKIIIELISGM